jgi:tumor protein p53-inducible protein 3
VSVSRFEPLCILQVWITAFLELVLLAGIKQGDKVLIHAGASGVGTAAIQIAKDKGAKVFVTAGSQEKLDFCKVL